MSSLRFRWATCCCCGTAKVCCKDAGEEWCRKCCGAVLGDMAPDTLRPPTPPPPKVESAEPSLEWVTVGAGDWRWAGGVKKDAGRLRILKGFCKGTWLEGFSTTSKSASSSLSLSARTWTIWLPRCSIESESSLFELAILAT